MANRSGEKLRRALRRFQRRSIGVRVGIVSVVVVAIAGISYGIDSGSSKPSANAGQGPPPAVEALDKASTSSAGVTSTTISVGFPVSNLEALASNLGFAGDIEYSEQVKAINLFVDQINDRGGINGRRIKPVIVDIDPTNEVDMRAVCKQWTEGSGAVFAVLDGVGDWTGDDQLCITQEGHTPLISQWSSVPSWAALGSPYLWWTGPNQAQVLQATVDWARSDGSISKTKTLGVIAGDRPSDQVALDDYLLPDLKKAGVKSVVITMPAEPSEFSSTESDAPLVVQKLHSDGVGAVLPLIPFTAMFPVLGAETSQGYFPKLLLSDYEFSIESSLGLIPYPYSKALNGQEGVTTETLGGTDDDRPYSQGGYDPRVRACFDIWHKAYPQIPKGNLNFYIEEQGPIQGWCQEINLLAQAATAAGRDLNKRTFVEAMSRISNFAGGYSPILSYAPGKFAGPTEYRIVRLHINLPPSDQCRLPRGHNPPQLVCWSIVKNWHPLPSG
ncbi:MAG: ABC transporter substrate-binding protein [Acidimicrobiales bacterium]